MARRQADLLARDAARRIAESDRTRRVRVYTPDGALICLAGLGAGEDVMTFPACYQVASALSNPQWIRERRPGDQEPFIAGRYKKLENAEGVWIKPTDPIHEGGRIAEPEDLMGMCGSTMAAVFSVRNQQAVEEAPMADLTRIKTPSTPESEDGFLGSPVDVVEVEIATPRFSEEEAEDEDEVKVGAACVGCPHPAVDDRAPVVPCPSWAPCGELPQEERVSNEI